MKGKAAITQNLPQTLKPIDLRRKMWAAVTDATGVTLHENKDAEDLGGGASLERLG